MHRRRFLGRGLAVGAAGLLGSPGAAAASQGDRTGVDSALRAELLIAFVYRQVLAGGTLGAVADAMARTILSHHEIHVRTLAAELAAPAPAPPAGAAEADRRLAARKASGRLAGVHTEDDALRLLYDVESISIGVYYKALANLSRPSLTTLAAEIMGAEAQHAAAIGGLLHPGKWDRVVPVGSVQGKH